MSGVGPIVGKEDEFERRYTEKFRALVNEHGEFLQYERDRAALDIGLHITTPTEMGRRVTATRIWFQLKGIHKETISAGDYQLAPDISVRVPLDHLRFWVASPEPIYLAIYLEALDKFIAEDVREVVYRNWGEDFFDPKSFQDGQQTVTVKVRKDAVLNRDSITLMRRHQSMRIDGPFFRGRPLGHRLDPLRCSLNILEPSTYVSIVKRLLDVHDYRATDTFNAALLFSAGDHSSEQIALTCGRLHNTFEWVPQLFTEFGTDGDDDFRIEGPPEFAHGAIAVCIHGDPQSRPHPESIVAFARQLRERDIPQLLVFANTHDYAYFGSFFGGFRETGIKCVPQLLGELAYSLLTVTAVYLEFREGISWKWRNYL